MRLVPLALLGLLLAAGPALAARTNERHAGHQAGPSKAAVAAPAAAAARRGHATPARGKREAAAAHAGRSAGRHHAARPAPRHRYATPAAVGRRHAVTYRGGAVRSRGAVRGGRVILATHHGRGYAPLCGARGWRGAWGCGGRAYAGRTFVAPASAASYDGGGVGGWARGLEPAARVQAAGCPAGTMATLATGHADVVRCMPI